MWVLHFTLKHFIRQLSHVIAVTINKLFVKWQRYRICKTQKSTAKYFAIFITILQYLYIIYIHTSNGLKELNWKNPFFVGSLERVVPQAPGMNADWRAGFHLYRSRIHRRSETSFCFLWGSGLFTFQYLSAKTDYYPWGKLEGGKEVHLRWQKTFGGSDAEGLLWQVTLQRYLRSSFCTFFCLAHNCNF